MRIDDIFPEDEIRKLPDSDWRYRMILGTEPCACGMRGCTERLLNFAEKQGVLDTEMLSRLKSQDQEQFRSAVYELAVAEFLSPIGEINWHPPGRDARIGEFEISPEKHETIFVEVKTIFNSADAKMRDRNWEYIRVIAHSIPSPFYIAIEFDELPCDIIPRRFRVWLTRQLAALASDVKEIGEEREVVFGDEADDGSLIKIKVQFIRTADNHLTLCENLWWGEDEKIQVHERVKEVVDGALAQLPDTKPNIVIVVPALDFGIDELQMLTAWFSFPKVTYNIGTSISEQKSELHYSLQGIVRPSMRKRLSAVGVWHHEWTKEPKGSLDIYHNPLCARQISPDTFTLPMVCQLVPEGEGIMKWIPNRPQR